MKWLVLVLALVLPASAAAATSAKLDQEAISRIAAGDSRMTEVQRVHPTAVWTATYREASQTWIARLREPSRSILATITVRDADSVVTAAKVNPGALDTHLLTKNRAETIAATSPKVRDWLARYTDEKAKVTSSTAFENGNWVRHWWAGGAEVARVIVNDKTGTIQSAWTGPQVAWSMARGSKGAFGRQINEPWIFGPLLLLFVAGLFDWRRILSLRNLDLVALASFTVSLWYFNEGLVFWSVPLQYPPLIYLFVRMVAIGCGRARRASYTTRWPVWVVAGLAVFALGFRAGLNFWSSNVIDVGYASVAGSDRLLSGSIPYNQMPKVTSTPCGPKYSDGSYSAYKQKSGACESPVERGDTYGPVMYYAYVPATAALGWSGRWDDLPAAHGTAVAFDALAAAGLALAGWRLGRGRLAATLLFCWATFPFTTYAMSSNSNDAIIAACVAWAIALFSFPFMRGLMLGFGAWAKFAPLLLVPLFLRADRRPAAEPAEWPYDAAGPPLLTRPTRWRQLRQPPRPGRGRRSIPARSGGVDAGRVRGARGPGRAVGARHVLEPHVRLAARPAVAVLGLGLGRLPRLPRSRGAAEGAEGRPRRARRRPLLRAAAPGCRPGGRLRGGAADRVPDRAHALVLPVHPVVHAVRGSRPLRGPAGPRPGARRRAGAARSRRRASRPRSRPARAPPAGVSRAGSGPPRGGARPRC